MHDNKLVNKKDYIKWYHLARETINDEKILPTRTDEQIINMVSRENWLNFYEKGQNKEQAKNSAKPNVFLSIISQSEGILGLTFNNIPAFEKFKTIMSSFNQTIKEKLSNYLVNLESTWKIEIERKVKDYNYAQKPKYLLVKSWDSNKLNQEIVDEIIKIGKEIRAEGKEKGKEAEAKNGFYRETPLINLMVAKFSLNEEEFKKRIREVFRALAICNNVKGDSEINKIIKAKENEIEALENELKEKENDQQRIEWMKSMGTASQENIEEKQKEIIKIKEKLNELRNEIGKDEDLFKNNE